MTIVQELRTLIDDVRKIRGFERVTVVTPTKQASFYLRRALARGGLFNVDFKRLEDVAEQLAGREFKEPLLHDLQASEFVYEAARDPNLGTRLGGTDVSPQLQTALHSTFRDLELLERGQLDRLRAKGTVQRELVDRFDSYMNHASQHRRGAAVAKRAAKMVRDGQGSGYTSPAVSGLGTVLLAKVAPVAPVQRLLFDELAKLQDSAIVTTLDQAFDDVMASGAAVPGAQKSSGSFRQKLVPVGVPDVAEEVRSVVREIVDLARSDARGKTTNFARMAVVFEDDTYATRVSEAFELAGIPVSGPDRTALADSPEGQFVTGLLDIFENDFTRLDVTAWFSTAPVRNPSADRPVPAARWDALSRTAGVTLSVRDSWIPRLDQYAAHRIARAERSDRLGEGRSNEIAAATSDSEYALALKEFVETFANRSPTAEQDSWPGFGSWLRAMTKDYLLAVGSSSTDSTAVENRQTRLTTLIERLESLETPGKVPGFKHCAGVLREQMGRRSAGLRSLGSGVYVGPIWTAAGCPFDTVFILGMTEGRYPTAGISDPLLPDKLKREIDAAGRYLRTVESSIEESKQSFTSVISSAERVVMYWPRGVPGESRELGPARWFLEAARQVSGEPLLQAGQLVRPEQLEQPVSGVVIHNRAGLSTLPMAQAGDQHEFDVLAARSWNRGGKNPATFPLSAIAPSITDSVDFETKQQSETWSEYDGKIDLGGAESDLGETVGSATAFETYAACPYRYFLSRKLHVEPTESPEPELALDALTFGTLIHDVLEKFALWRMGHDGAPPNKPNQESWLQASVASHIQALREETPGRAEGVWRIEQSRAWLILRRWLRREPTVALRSEMHQVEAEYSFGSDTGRPAVEVRTTSGKSVKFRGQVDRVDISDDGSRVIVYDYKSGSNSAYSKLKDDPVKRGTKLQLPLYSMAVADKYPNASVSAAYWFVRESGSDELQPSPENYAGDRAELALKEAVETIVEGIDSGVFPAHPGDPSAWGGGPPSFENCKFCEYNRICPKSKARLWESKKTSNPVLDNYRRLAEDDR